MFASPGIPTLMKNTSAQMYEENPIQKYDCISGD